MNRRTLLKTLAAVVLNPDALSNISSMLVHAGLPPQISSGQAIKTIMKAHNFLFEFAMVEGVLPQVIFAEEPENVIHENLRRCARSIRIAFMQWHAAAAVAARDVEQGGLLARALTLYETLEHKRHAALFDYARHSSWRHERYKEDFLNNYALQTFDTFHLDEMESRIGSMRRSIPRSIGEKADIIDNHICAEFDAKIDETLKAMGLTKNPYPLDYAPEMNEFENWW